MAIMSSELFFEAHAQFHRADTPDVKPVLEPIGVVRSSLRSAIDAPKQGAEGAPSAWIELEQQYAPGILFGTRSADRPNSVGLHPVTLLAIEGLRLHVSPLEATDGTPVLDIKPVL